MDLIERRLAKRYEVRLTGQVSVCHSLVVCKTNAQETQQSKHLEKHTLPILISNISQSGLQFSADIAAMPLLVSQQIQTNAMRPVQVKIQLNIPTISLPIEIHAGIVYVKRQTVNRCHVGVRFESFEGKASSILSQYIARL